MFNLSYSKNKESILDILVCTVTNISGYQTVSIIKTKQ